MAKAKTPLVVTDNVCVMLQVYCGVMLCICTWLLPLFRGIVIPIKQREYGHFSVSISIPITASAFLLFQ